MKLNAVEKAVINNPARAALQRRYEAKLLERLGGRVPEGRALEVGCGRGVGIEIILDSFGAGSVDGFDLDSDMVAKAHRRLAGVGDRVRLWVGDATRIDAADAGYDAVFDFGIVHHIPDWTAAVNEIARVLRPGGRFYFEESPATPSTGGPTGRSSTTPPRTASAAPSSSSGANGPGWRSVTGGSSGSSATS